MSAKLIYTNDFITSITIAEIILHFFSLDHKRVFSYVCDPADGKMKARIHKFNYWYGVFANNDFRKIVVLLDKHGVNIEANFIFLKNNTYAYDIPAIIEAAKNKPGGK